MPEEAKVETPGEKKPDEDPRIEETEKEADTTKDEKASEPEQTEGKTEPEKKEPPTETKPPEPKPIEFGVDEAKKLTDIFEVVGKFIDEVVIEIDEKNGFKICQSDTSMVSVVDARIEPKFFNIFQGSGKAFFNVTALMNILKRVGKEELSARIQENRMVLFVEKGRRCFTVPLLDLKSSSFDKPPIDRLNFTAKTKIDREILDTSIGDAEIFGETIKLESNDQAFFLSAKGDISGFITTLQKGVKGIYTLSGKGKSTYPLEYIKKVSYKGSDSVTLEWGNDFPVRISYEKPGVSLKLIIAPKVID